MYTPQKSKVSSKTNKKVAGEITYKHTDSTRFTKMPETRPKGQLLSESEKHKAVSLIE